MLAAGRAAAAARGVCKAADGAAAVRQAHVEGWAKEWGLGVEDERALLLAAADVLRASKKKKAGPPDGYRLALKALATYQVQSPRALRQNCAGLRNAAMPGQAIWALRDAHCAHMIWGIRVLPARVWELMV